MIFMTFMYFKIIFIYKLKNTGLVFKSYNPFKLGIHGVNI